MAKPGSDRDGAMVDKQAGKKVCDSLTSNRSFYYHPVVNTRNSSCKFTKVILVFFTFSWGNTVQNWTPNNTQVILNTTK